MHGFARHCQDSLYAVFDAQGLELRELPDWNCRGATTYISVDENQSFALGARNLAMAEKLGLDMAAPCTACLMILKKTQGYLARYGGLRGKIDRALAKGADRVVIVATGAETPPSNHTAAEAFEVKRMFKPEEGAGATMLSGTLEEVARQMVDLFAERRVVR